MSTKENNCQCAVCQLEDDLLDSLNRQKARIHFQTLASSYAILNRFDSAADIVPKLRERDDVEVVDRIGPSAILHALVNSIADVE